MSNKKAKRKKAWLERERKRAAERKLAKDCKKALSDGSIEDMAALMGIKLK